MSLSEYFSVCVRCIDIHQKETSNFLFTKWWVCVDRKICSTWWKLYNERLNMRYVYIIRRYTHYNTHNIIENTYTIIENIWWKTRINDMQILYGENYSMKDWMWEMYAPYIDTPTIFENIYTLIENVYTIIENLSWKTRIHDMHTACDGNDSIIHCM